MTTVVQGVVVPEAASNYGRLTAVSRIASVGFCGSPFRGRKPLQRQTSLGQDPRIPRSAGSRRYIRLADAKEGIAGFKTVGTSVLATLLLCTLAWPAESTAAVQQLHSHQSELYQVATGDTDFWVNVTRYGRYFITVLLGTAYITVKPILALLKRPKTAIAVILGAGVLYLFVSTTVQAMLGVSNPLEYQPSGLFPDNY